MIVLDDPRHQRLRSIVSRAFTPKVVARIETSVRERAHRLVASLIANHPDGQADLVSELAGPLPLQVICDMMGIPEEDHQRIFHWTNVILGFGDPDLTTDFDEFLQVSMDIGAYATALAEDRRVQSPRRPDDQPGRGRGRRRPAVIAGDRVVLHPAGGGRQRDDAQCDQPRRAGAVPLPRAAGKVVVGLRRAGTHRGRGDRAVGLAGDLYATHADSGLRAERHQDGGRRQGHAVVQLGQPRRVKVRQSVGFRRGTQPQPACRLRRRRRPFLPGRQPGSSRDPGRVRRIAPPNSRYRRDRRTGATAVAIHSRHQEPAGRLDYPLPQRR